MRKLLLILGISAGLSACKPKPPLEAQVNAWYKHLVIYNLDVKTFQDSNGDGEGDFKGLISRLDYLSALGVNTIWLAPFQPSPLADDGYDITDYTAIDAKLGTAADFRIFMRQAKARHLKVIMDIVLNHTSIQHPWFRQKPDWYLWSKERPSDWDKGMGFPVVEKDSWHLDSLSHQYFFHRFYHFEPDLNYQNPAVVREAERVLAYWLDQGMDGFRLDAVPFIIDDPRKDAAKPRFDFNILHKLTGFVSKHNPQAVLLGEANVDPQDNGKYFTGHHEGLQMMFNFYANQYLFLALASGDAGQFKKALTQTQVKPGIAQWAWFLRNHDEIDLGRLSKHELNQVYQKMGPDTNMQLYKRGLRRRLATMLGGDPKQINLAYSLLFSLPGTPVIREGEEIGMGEDLRLKERLAIRTPMQWDSTVNGGFTKGKPFRPLISSAEYGYQKVNVQTETKDSTSLLHKIRTLIKQRQAFPEIDNGAWQVLKTPDTVLALLYSSNGKQALIINNFSRKPQELNYKGRIYHLATYGTVWQHL
ncbi:maltose alpha-D-glucosyltransferase/ alpha-amylase [Mucilaginibacter pineti]|uniref:Maltose alpha-D-glucosyltransferase/ alpha-amylase n=2 Tax=Mucilaginibacter pineti TaxID=1391627 RepID=A0A1G7H4U6_9SPHI|nr:maltose alpha-D-glucosyltransferase/ alpha-amylase [Mucilaginibacter pineti]